ncbi:hypothetical protein ANSO36C_05810 [Nostoc cf. commune SO-36]|uniref:Transposase n=1 Tax=Nostoc cf. commune SO-36 TaxID=449208 RepID=A0ABN6PZ09_NOSCO|nr:hypothetical protein ANSO36C_05810 [Nostoc cf. commune SO-36]
MSNFRRIKRFQKRTIPEKINAVKRIRCLGKLAGNIAIAIAAKIGSQIKTLNMAIGDFRKLVIVINVSEFAAA